MKCAVVLHNIRSVHNVGSIFRTADAAGFEKIYLCGITPTPLDRFKNVRADFAKVALGAEKSVAWEYAKTTKEAIAKMKQDEWKIFAVEQSRKSIPYYAIGRALASPRKMQKIALVLGNEVDGIPPAILKLADATLEIPMSGKKESLNVAVAFGIVAFDLRFRHGAVGGTI
jgi:23S rRNA (guanosine2251-2'-O)-methyltransferase